MQYKVTLRKKINNTHQRPKETSAPPPLLTLALLWETLCHWFACTKTAFSHVSSQVAGLSEGDLQG